MNELHEILLNYYQGKDGKKLSAADLVTRIKSQSVSPDGLRLTNLLDKRPFFLNDIELLFEYKRDNLQIRSRRNILPHFGLYKNTRGHVQISLLNSGQAGIHIACSYIKHVLKLNRIDSLTQSYIGTSQLAEVLKLKFNRNFNQKTSKVLWICSAYFTQKDLHRINDRHYEHVFIDTTCWTLDSSILKTLLKIFRERKIYLIRSHSKLDMGGIEYGSLGSIVTVSPVMNNISITKLITLMSGAPSLDDIPPYFFDSKFLQFNNQRGRRIESISKKLTASLNCPTFETLLPEHGKYFLLKISQKSLKECEQKFLMAMKFANVSFLRAQSFGFNITVYSFYVDERSDIVLRICPGLENHESILNVLNVFHQMIKR